MSFPVITCCSERKFEDIKSLLITIDAWSTNYFQVALFSSNYLSYQGTSTYARLLPRRFIFEKPNSKVMSKVGTYSPRFVFHKTKSKSQYTQTYNFHPWSGTFVSANLVLRSIQSFSQKTLGRPRDTWPDPYPGKYFPWPHPAPPSKGIQAACGLAHSYPNWFFLIISGRKLLQGSIFWLEFSLDHWVLSSHFD